MIVKRICPDCGVEYEKESGVIRTYCKCPGCFLKAKKLRVIKDQEKRRRNVAEIKARLGDPIEQRIKEIQKILEPYYIKLEKRSNCGLAEI